MMALEQPAVPGGGGGVRSCFLPVRAPVERRMLVGGMTGEFQPGANELNLYLFVEVAVQELRDDDLQGKPEVKSAPLPATLPKR